MEVPGWQELRSQTSDLYLYRHFALQQAQSGGFVILKSRRWQRGKETLVSFHQLPCSYVAWFKIATVQCSFKRQMYAFC